jgi:hypothetical protein
MNGLRIVGGNNATIEWVYKGQFGVSTITPQGVVQTALLLSQDFDLVPPIGSQIIQECQTWRDQQAGTYTGPSRFRVNSQFHGSNHEYSVLAHNENAAIMLAFALDGGISQSVRRIEKGHLELAKEYCEVVE